MSTQKRTGLIALIIGIAINCCLGQEPSGYLDSLKVSLEKSSDLADSLKILGRMAEHNMYNESYTAIKHADEIIRISKDADHGIGLSDGYFLKANGFGALQKMDSALMYYNKAIATSKQNGIDRNLASAMANI